MRRKNVESCGIGVNQAVGGGPAIAPTASASAERTRQAIVDFHQISRAALGGIAREFERGLQ